MKQELKLHPQSRCSAVDRIEVDIDRLKADAISLRYLVTGRISKLRLPVPTKRVRADELWRHTCFEAFVQALPGSAYLEFNFAPSTQWAAYAFSSYRTEMSVADTVPAPTIEIVTGVSSFELRATLGGLGTGRAFRLGLSAVIEDTNGDTSYWALVHPPGKPDFHHSDCFALEHPAAWTP